jgi:diguanylate cyclase (GGDEF)-like protein
MQDKAYRFRFKGSVLISIYLTIVNVLMFESHTNRFSSSISISVIYALSQGIATALCFFAYKKAPENRMLWLGAGFAMNSWFVKSSILAFFAASQSGQKELPAFLSIVLMVGYIPLIVYVLSNIGNIKFPLDPNRKRFLAGVSMIDLSLFLLVLEFVLIPYWEINHSTSIMAQIASATPVILDWLLITVLLFASHRLLEEHIPGWFVLAVPASFFNVASDIPLYFYGYTMNPATINLGAITAILVSASALEAATSGLIGTITSNRQRHRGKPKSSLSDKIPWNTLILPAVVLMCIPLIWTSHSTNGYNIGREVLGFISIAMVLLSIYRSHLLAIENQALLRDVRIDNLTGLYNHRHFHEQLTKQIISSNITKQPISLVVFDLDNFASINNENGHLFGDKVLATIGKCIKEHIGIEEQACRIGGDEFAIIMPDANQELAFSLAEKLKIHVQKSLEELVGVGSLTISFGISCYPDIADSKESLFTTADGALYWNKFHGKDSILVFDPSTVESLSAEERARKAENQLFLSMVNSLTEVVDAKDSYTMRHSKNVSELAGSLAKIAGFSSEAVRRIEAAGLLHDIGKIGVPDHILNKSGKLTDEEMLVIKNHPVASGHIIETTTLKDMAHIIRAHHERWDGKGYPDGLSGTDIPIESRILAIVDTFDAMTTDRPYRNGCKIEDALVEINRCAGTQFDPELTKKFVAIFDVEKGTKIKKQAL